MANGRQWQECFQWYLLQERVRSQDDKTYWSKLEDYLSQRIGTKVSYSIVQPATKNTESRNLLV